MITELKINDLTLPEGYRANFRPSQVDDNYIMLAGNRRQDIIAQKRSIVVMYQTIEATEYELIFAEYEKAEAVTVSGKRNGIAFSFSASMSPPPFDEPTVENATVDDVSFTLDEM